MPYLERQGADLFYELSGIGNPPLVFVHGFCCTHHDWQYQEAFFRARNTVVTCDLRGHGDSDRTSEQCAIETFGADVHALLTALALPPAVLIGHSMGCRVVLQTAYEAPEHTAGVVLVDGSRLAEGDPATAEWTVRERMEAEGYPAMVQRLFRDMFLPDADPALVERLLTQAMATPEEVGALVFPRLAAWDARHMDMVLSQVRVPLLVIQSTYLNADQVRMPLQAGQTTPWLDLVQRYHPTTQVEILSGVGHFPMLEAPEAVNRAIVTFVDRLARA
jgi:pimeloyl-ACP methyl ester carboxylesterase